MSIVFWEDYPLEKAKQIKEAHGEIDTQHPSYLGAQDTYYVGNMKGVGEYTNKPLLTIIPEWLFANSILINLP